MEKTKVEDLQEKIWEPQKQREEITLQKGAVAQDNKDLRENSAYIYLEQKEHLLTSLISQYIQELYNSDEVKNSPSLRRSVKTKASKNTKSKVKK